MKSPSLTRIGLAMVLIVGLGVQWTGAAEKIQFSTGSKDKDGQQNNLAIKQNKPALQTLDFNRMGGRGSKAEEMAPMPPPPKQTEARLPSEKKKQDKDWQLNNDEQDPKDAEDQGDKSGKNGDREKDRKKNQNDRHNSNSRAKNDKPWSPYDRDDDDSNSRRNNFDKGLNRSGSTNRIVFGSANRPSDQPFRAERAPGSPLDNRGLPPGSGPNPLADTSRSETLRVLGIEKNPAGVSISGGNPGSNPQGIPGIGGWDNGSKQAVAGPLDTLNTRSPSAGLDSPQNFGSRDTGFKSSLGGDLNSLNMGQSGRAPIGYEPPKYERKPAVLPIPQRKF